MKSQSPDLNQQADELAELLDSLVSSGTQHIHLKMGEETKIQTINSTECSGTLGACAIPNFASEEDEDYEEKSQ